MLANKPQEATGRPRCCSCVLVGVAAVPESGSC